MIPHLLLRLAIGAAMALPLSFAALAQTSPSLPPPQDRIPEKVEPSAPERPARADESLSDRLGRTDGVIQPPSGVDPGITAPAPDPLPGTTPVIPPPGSLGGDPSIRPK